MVRPVGWLGIGVALYLTACTSIPVADYGQAAGVPERVELSAVPFNPQQAYQCGPAALSTLLEHAGQGRHPDELKSEVFLPQRQGSLQAELLAATRRAGLLPYVLEPGADLLLREVAAGHPVLVLQDLGWPLMPRWHYAVVVGYDRPAREMILRSGSEPRLVMDFAAFERSWAKAGRWAFIAVAPDRLPASATESRFVNTVVALEAVSPAAAGRAYGTALEQWPGNLLARLGLGNAAYRRHELVLAEAAYRQATIDHPAAAIAWNNLAQTLHQMGRRPEALAAARRAVKIGGAWQGVYAATLAAIEGGRRTELRPVLPGQTENDIE